MATEQFHYTTESKKKLTLPHFGNLPFGVVRKLRKEEESEQIFLVFEELFKNDPKQLEILDEMGQSEVMDLIAAWQKASGVTVGESQESSDS
ncbi:hypothetical protein [Corynebacterium renale]|uniref:hypothetical protein n=1 Tax=Corynebacterium renale TaxID=1724 RepID=UPI000E064280|nr:hypothetical protein [Corynebacterium renale]STC97534.1 Uncharacterised protein [Corynebacterium renale]